MCPCQPSGSPSSWATHSSTTPSSSTRTGRLEFKLVDNDSDYMKQIASLVARELGRRPQFIQVAWSSIEASAERGDFEIGFSGVEDSPARRAEHAVTLPYYEFREVLAVRPQDSGRFRRSWRLAPCRVSCRRERPRTRVRRGCRRVVSR